MNDTVLTFSPEEVASLELTTSRERAGATRGNPVETFERVFEDDATMVGFWECTPGRFPVRRDGSHSYMQIVAGEGAIIDADGTEHRITPGSVHVEPDGWEGEWDITSTVRKFYVIKKVPAGN